MNYQDLKRRLAEHGLLSLVSGICLEHCVPLDFVLMGSRSASVTRAKTAIIVTLSSAPYSKSAPEVGYLLGLDHSSVYYALRKAADTRPLTMRIADARAVLRVS